MVQVRVLPETACPLPRSRCFIPLSAAFSGSTGGDLEGVEGTTLAFMPHIALVVVYIAQPRGFHRYREQAGCVVWAGNVSIAGGAKNQRKGIITFAGPEDQKYPIVEELGGGHRASREFDTTGSGADGAADAVDDNHFRSEYIN